MDMELSEFPWLGSMIEQVIYDTNNSNIYIHIYIYIYIYM